MKISLQTIIFAVRFLGTSSRFEHFRFLAQIQLTYMNKSKQANWQILVDSLKNHCLVHRLWASHAEPGETGQFLFSIFFYTLETFYCLFQILHTLTEYLQLRWPLCVSVRPCTFFLQLLTQLKVKHCILFLKFSMIRPLGRFSRSCNVRKMCLVSSVDERNQHNWRLLVNDRIANIWTHFLEGFNDFLCLCEPAYCS